MKIVFGQVFGLLLMATVDKHCITINLFDFEAKFLKYVRLQRNDGPIS